MMRVTIDNREIKPQVASHLVIDVTRLNEAEAICEFTAAAGVPAMIRTGQKLHLLCNHDAADRRVGSVKRNKDGSVTVKLRPVAKDGEK